MATGLRDVQLPEKYFIQQEIEVLAGMGDPEINTGNRAECAGQCGYFDKIGTGADDGQYFNPVIDPCCF